MNNQISQDLCKQCNMCCDGTLFHSTPVDKSTEHLFTNTSQRPNGCEQLSQCGSCKIYEMRPTGCRAYKCGVLQDLEKGHLTFKEAEKIVKDVKDAIAAPDVGAGPQPMINAFQRWGRIMYRHPVPNKPFYLPGMESSEKNSDL